MNTVSKSVNTTADAPSETKKASDTVNQYFDIEKNINLQEDGKCTNAFKLISDKKLLIAAYLELKSKPGMMTKGSEEETVDGIDDK